MTVKITVEKESKTRAASVKTQKKWVPERFRLIKGPNRCYSNADRLARSNKLLRMVEGITRIDKKDKWGEHAWCITPSGSVIDPYFRHRFPKEWHYIEYRADGKLY